MLDMYKLAISNNCLFSIRECRGAKENASAEVFYYGEEAPNKAALKAAVEKAGFKVV